MVCDIKRRTIMERDSHQYWISYDWIAWCGLILKTKNAWMGSCSPRWNDHWTYWDALFGTQMMPHLRIVVAYNGISSNRYSRNVMHQSLAAVAVMELARNDDTGWCTQRMVLFWCSRTICLHLYRDPWNFQAQDRHIKGLMWKMEASPVRYWRTVPIHSDRKIDRSNTVSPIGLVGAEPNPLKVHFIINKESTQTIKENWFILWCTKCAVCAVPFVMGHIAHDKRRH